jgi:hypothetical protein
MENTIFCDAKPFSLVEVYDVLEVHAVVSIFGFEE